MGKLLRDGVSVAIVGPPNVGKSSLFNSLLEHDRAIVTHIAGTTRDTLEESALLDGVVFRLTDTAGIRESSDIVESIGIDRTRITITSSDVVLLVCDDQSLVGNRVSALLDPTYAGKTVIVRNKSDLLPHIPADLLDREPPEIHVSAKTGYGVDVLRSILSSLAGVSVSAGEGGQLITRERHRAALQTTLDRLMAARETVLEGTSTEFIALDIRGATEALGEITGEVTTEEILNNIFSSFCVGK
jgi:tRNA modification GTPase